MGATADRQKKCERIPSLTDESAGVGGGGGKNERRKEGRKKSNG